MLLPVDVFWAWGVRQRTETSPSRQGDWFQHADRIQLLFCLRVGAGEENQQNTWSIMTVHSI
jgi:hypothetical protein